jgi:hypothetical protein
MDTLISSFAFNFTLRPNTEAEAVAAGCAKLRKKLKPDHSTAAGRARQILPATSSNAFQTLVC